MSALMERFAARPRWRTVLLTVAPMVALGVVWWVSRAPQDGAADRDDAQASNATHDHAAMGSTMSESPGAVMLTAEQAHRIGITFAPVTTGPLAHEVRTVAQVMVDETRASVITARADGWAERLHVNFTGQEVRAGEALLDLHSPMLVTAQEELLLALRLARNVGTEAQANATELVASARQRLRWLEVPEAEIARLERTGEVSRVVTLRAPSDGIVLDKPVVAGQRVMAGETLYQIADLSAVWIEGDVYEQDLRALRVGQAALVELDAFPGERWVGRVAYVQPTLSPETRTARVRVELANPRRQLKPGMFATLHLSAIARQRTLSVPRSAVLATGQRTLVFVQLADGRLEPRPVIIGMTTDDRIEIIRGLQPGETVVASATFLVDAESNLGTALGGMGDMPGMEITIPPAATPPRRERR